MLHCHRARHPHLRGLGSFLRVQRHRPYAPPPLPQYSVPPAKKFIAISIVLFAFATLIGWSYYGERAVSYLLGDRAVPLYKILFAAVVLLGSTVRMELAWSLSDTFNALLAIPNLIAITILSREVFQLTKDYVHRYFLTQKTANSQRIKAAVPGHNRCRRG